MRRDASELSTIASGSLGSWFEIPIGHRVQILALRHTVSVRGSVRNRRAPADRASAPARKSHPYELRDSHWSGQRGAVPEPAHPSATGSVQTPPSSLQPSQGRCPPHPSMLLLLSCPPFAPPRRLLARALRYPCPTLLSRSNHRPPRDRGARRSRS